MSGASRAFRSRTGQDALSEPENDPSKADVAKDAKDAENKQKAVEVKQAEQDTAEKKAVDEAAGGTPETPKPAAKKTAKKIAKKTAKKTATSKKS